MESQKMQFADSGLFAPFDASKLNEQLFKYASQAPMLSHCSDGSPASSTEYELANTQNLGGNIAPSTEFIANPHESFTNTTTFGPTIPQVFSAGSDWVPPDHISPASHGLAEMNDMTNVFGAPIMFPEEWNVPQAIFPPMSRGNFAAPTAPINTSMSSTMSNPTSSRSVSATQSPLSHHSPTELKMEPTNFSSPTVHGLTAAQQQQLTSIAMPPHLVQQASLKTNDGDWRHGNADSMDGSKSPESAKTKNRKRKSISDDDGDDDEDNDESHPMKKTAHNMIEKRYRTNLNDKIAMLRDSVPSLRIMSKSAKGEDTTEDREELHGLTPAHKLNKATVLSKATEYIRHLEKRQNRLVHENEAMSRRLSAFEQLYMAGAINTVPSSQNKAPSPGSYHHEQSMHDMGLQMDPSRMADPHGLVQMPRDLKGMGNAHMMAGPPYQGQVNQYQQQAAVIRKQQIQQQAQMQAHRWNNAGPYFGKLMVGSLAGLMIVEAIRETEQSNDTTTGRGLFSMPLEIVRYFFSGSHLSVGGVSIPLLQLISTLKAVLILGAFLWVFVPSLFVPGISDLPKSAKGAPLRALPSLASPIHVRRQAWLTAIQTVWVPRHNFAAEVAAITLKIIKISLRNLMGVEGYQILTGLTEEQETARVQAWNIALDAQLAGGDVEINRTRLVLTWLAAKTLPSTPLRHIMNAIHVSVLKAEGEHAWTSVVVAKIASTKWRSAIELQRANTSRTAGGSPAGEELPEHLAVLLEQDCADVLNPVIAQRAFNLAWNLPTTSEITEDVDGMNAVVDDPAVRSPPDAIAAWWSSWTLQRVLSNWLADGTKDPATKQAIAAGLEKAIKSAPIGSNAQGRALVAKALLVDEKRGASIAHALQSLAPSLNPDKHPDYSNGVPPLIDSPRLSIEPDSDTQMALRCTMAIAQLQRHHSPDVKTLAVVDSILRDSSSKGMSLLGFTAAFQLMERLHAHPVAAETCRASLERLSGTLRVWVGSSEGERPGLGRNLRKDMVARCLAITKSVVGVHEDEGYMTMSEANSESGKCSFD